MDREIRRRQNFDVEYEVEYGQIHEYDENLLFGVNTVKYTVHLVRVGATG